MLLVVFFFLNNYFLYIIFSHFSLLVSYPFLLQTLFFSFCRGRLKMRERPKYPLVFFRGVYCGESSLKFQMYNKQKANGALTRENQNANNKSVEKA